jgi:hypothetical protein
MVYLIHASHCSHSHVSISDTHMYTHMYTHMCFVIDPFLSMYLPPFPPINLLTNETYETL